MPVRYDKELRGIKRGASRSVSNRKTGEPSNNEGADNDIQIRSSTRGISLFAKYNGKWYKSSLQDPARAVEINENEGISLPASSGLHFQKGNSTIRVNQDGGLMTESAVGGVGITSTNANAGDIRLKISGSGDVISDVLTGSFKINVGDTNLFKFDAANNALYNYKTSTDYFKLQTAANGATTLTTVDNDGTDGDFTLDIDGDITLNADGGLFTIQDGTTLNGKIALDMPNQTLTMFDGNSTEIDDYFKITLADSGVTTLSTNDGSGGSGADKVGHFTIDADGDITLDAASGNIYVKDDGGNYTPGSDYEISTKKYVDDNIVATTFQLEDGDGTEVTISNAKEVKFVEGENIDIDWTDTDNGTDGDPYDLTFGVKVPYVIYSSFQDDMGTTKHYLPIRDVFEQTWPGTEQASMMIPFNMTLQKAVMRCNEDISGATWTLGMFAVDSGSSDAHHHTTGRQWVTATGGAQHTNTTFDFTGTVGDGTNSSGGSNAVTAGQLISFQLFADTDVTSSNAEFWLSFLFHVDMSNTI